MSNEHNRPADLHVTGPNKTETKAPTVAEVAAAIPDRTAVAAAAAAAKPESKELSVGEIMGAFMLPLELAETSAPVRARSDKQRVMDDKVKELHAAWTKAGKPNTWAKMVETHTVATYFVEPDKSAELHRLINRAVALHGVRSRLGASFTVTEKHVAKFNLPKEYVGREAISFAVMDKRPRATSDGKPAAAVIANHGDKPATTVK